MTHMKLTLSCPAALGEQVTDYLLTSEWLDAGFMTVAAQGHGHDFAAASPLEKVRGQVRSLHILVILPAENVIALLDALRARFRNPHMLYWTEPVHALGDFA